MNSFKLLHPQSLANLLPTHVRHLLLSAMIILSGQAQCQNVDCHFSLYRMDTKFADALQAKLLAGGQDATQAMKIMPDLVKQRRATLLADLKKQTPDKQRDKVSAGTAIHKNRDGSESRLGLEIDYEPTIAPSSGTVDFRLLTFYHVEEDKVVKGRSLSSSFTAKPNIPVLVVRWQEGELNLILVASATWESPATNEKPVAPVLYLDHAIYQTEADATANRDPVQRTVHPAKSRAVASAGGGLPIDYEYEDEWISDYASWGFESEPNLSEDTSFVGMNMMANHKQVTGKTTRTPDGFRRPELIMRSADGSARIKIGETHTVDMPVDKNAGNADKAPSWKLSSKCLLYEVK